MLSAEKLASFFDLQFSREPVRLTERLIFLGEIERVTDFEAQKPLGAIGSTMARKATTPCWMTRRWCTNPSKVW